MDIIKENGGSSRSSRTSTELDKSHKTVNDMQNESELKDGIRNCKKPFCDDTDIECVYNLIYATICEAILIIESDPRALFCYKYPTNMSSVPAPNKNYDLMGFWSDSTATTLPDPTEPTQWLKIRDFEYSNVIPQVRDFISKWRLSPETKCVVLANPKKHDVPLKGTIHFIDAHFSRPTPSCPNPLAVAKVRFIVTVSKVMQTYYPIMVTYRFEGFRTLFYALGERNVFSFVFQRFYIDTIMHTKLSFYAEICECRHGTIEKPKVIETPTGNDKQRK